MQVYYYNADYLKSVGSLNFDTSKKWAVVNVEVQDGQSTIDITGDYTKNGNKLDAEVDAVQTHNAKDAIKSAWGIDVNVNDDETELSLG